MSTPGRISPGMADLISLADPAVVPDPYPCYRRLREASPFSELEWALVVFGRHESCSRILRHPKASSERGKSALAARPHPAAPSGGRGFHPDSRRRTRTENLQLTGDLLTAAAESGELELVSQLAYPLPARIISDLLGVPPSDHARFATWSARLRTRCSRASAGRTRPRSPSPTGPLVSSAATSPS